MERGSVSAIAEEVKVVDCCAIDKGRIVVDFDRKRCLRWDSAYLRLKVKEIIIELLIYAFLLDGKFSRHFRVIF